MKCSCNFERTRNGIAASLRGGLKFEAPDPQPTNLKGKVSNAFGRVSGTSLAWPDDA
jgi:hypothetical protein